MLGSEQIAFSVKFLPSEVLKLLQLKEIIVTKDEKLVKKLRHPEVAREIVGAIIRHA